VILEISRSKIFRYTGNYDSYVAQKEALRAAA